MTSKRTAPLSLMAFLMLAAATGPARANGDVKVSAVEIGELPGQKAGDSAEVVIRGDRRLEFTLFRLQNPTRIVIDMPNADVASVQAPTDLPESGLVKAITTTQFRGKSGEVARVVVVMRGEVAFDAKNQGNAIVLTARREAALGMTPAVTAQAEAPARPDATPVVELSGDEEPIPAATRFSGIEAREAGGGTIVQLTTNGAVGRYEIEEVDNPARLVVDLYGIQGPKGDRKELSTPAVERARVAAHDGRTRVVLDGKGGTLPQYNVAATDNGITIVFRAPGEAPRPERAAELTDVTFHKKEGFWRLKLGVTAQASVRTVMDGPTKKAIVLDGVRANSSLVGKKDFHEGPLDGVEISAAGRQDGAVRVELLLASEVDHSVWQKGGAVFWDLRDKSQSPAPVASNDRPQPRAAPHAVTLSAAAHEGASARRYRGKKITIDLMDADIVNVLRLLGDVSGKNVVIGDEVKGKVTIKLKNVPVGPGARRHPEDQRARYGDARRHHPRRPGRRSSTAERQARLALAAQRARAEAADDGAAHPGELRHRPGAHPPDQGAALRARPRDLRSAHQRHHRRGHPRQPRAGRAARAHPRHADAAGAHRGPHGRGDDELHPHPRHPVGRRLVLLRARRQPHRPRVPEQRRHRRRRGLAAATPGGSAHPRHLLPLELRGEPPRR
jgi:type IV pilus assembly protein PilQ